MSFSKLKYDACYMNQQMSSNASIFKYVTDSSMYINNNECNNFTPPFLTYIPSGISERNMDIESDLKGITRQTSRCDESKYNPETAQKHNIKQKNECADDMKVVSQYIPGKR